MIYQKSKNVFLVLFIWLNIFMATSVLATTYFVDATNGLDNNSGTSETTAWKTIAKVNGEIFQPGDQV
jgi:regulatory protein YycI of two-component signal transduction system YycFG